MKPTIALCGLSVALLASTAVEAILPAIGVGTAAAGAIVLSGGTLGATTGGAGIIGGLILLKALAIKVGYIIRNNRQRRSAAAAAGEESGTDLAFDLIADSEPAACYRRLICDMATGSLPRSDNDVILSLFNKPPTMASKKYDYFVASALGKDLKNVETCELRYSCPLSGAQLSQLFE